MKKRWVLLASLLMGLLVLGACGSKESSQSKKSENDTLLTPGSIWKEEVGGRWYKLKIIDETTWEYSKEESPEPLQMTVKRVKDYQGLERYKLVDSAGADLLLGDEALVIPYKKDGMTVVNFIPTNSKEDRTKEELVDRYSGRDNYKLQKTE